MQGPAQQARTSSRFKHWSGHTVELAVAALSSSVRHLEKRGCSGGAAGKGLVERGSHLHCMGRGGQAPPCDSSPQPHAWRRHWCGVQRAATCLSLLEVERALLRCDGAAGGGARRVVVCEGQVGGCGGRSYDGAASSDRRPSECRPAARCRVPAHRQALPAMLPGWGPANGLRGHPCRAQWSWGSHAFAPVWPDAAPTSAAATASSASRLCGGLLLIVYVRPAVPLTAPHCSFQTDGAGRGGRFGRGAEMLV